MPIYAKEKHLVGIFYVCQAAFFVDWTKTMETNHWFLQQTVSNKVPKGTIFKLILCKVACYVQTQNWFTLVLYRDSGQAV